MLEILIPLLRNTGLMAVVALSYGLVLSHLPRAFAPMLLGLLCAFGALASMLDPIEMRPGVFVDSRTTMVMLASFFGGPIGALIAGGAASAYRIHIGGAGMYAGVTSMAIGAVIGIAGYMLFVRGGRTVRTKHVLGLSLLAPLCSLGVFMLTVPVAFETVGASVVPLNIARVSGVLLLGLMILHEQWRVDAEQEVRRLAFIDELSGLANRRAFYAELDDAWDRWGRYKVPFTVVMVDIDHFKGINDTHGHPTGDEVIRSLAQILNTECRSSDVAARVGGEEFAVLLVHAESIDAVQFAERVRKRVEATAVAFGEGEGGKLNFTVSLGVSRDLSLTSSRHDVLSSADQALYEAKHGGRNRVMLDTGVKQSHRPVATRLTPAAAQAS